MISHIIIFVSEGTFEIDDYNSTCYLYECIAALRALLLQKTAPSKYKKVKSKATNNIFYFLILYTGDLLLRFRNNVSL